MRTTEEVSDPASSECHLRRRKLLNAAVFSVFHCTRLSGPLMSSDSPAKQVFLAAPHITYMHGLFAGHAGSCYFGKYNSGRDLLPNTGNYQLRIRMW